MLRQSRSNQNATWCAMVVVVAALAVVATATPASARATTEVRRCAQAILKGLEELVSLYTEAGTDCQERRLETDKVINCTTDENAQKDREDAVDKLRRELEKCEGASFPAFCPLEKKHPEEFVMAAATGPTSLVAEIDDILAKLFTEDYGPGCIRPAISVDDSEVRECGKAIARSTHALLEEVQECFADCELKALKQFEPDACVDVTNGAPVHRKLSECVDRVLDDLLDGLDRRCTTRTLEVLGCPAGTTEVDELFLQIATMTTVFTEGHNLRTFHSSCRSESGITIVAVPAAVILHPSGTPKYVFCGDVLDDDFFGTDTRAEFRSNLNCDAARVALDGLVIAASDVTVDAGESYGITGPDRGRFRNGAGIRIAPGAQRVTIEGFRWIKRFGFGVVDSGDNDGLVISNSKIRRNDVVGMRLTSPEVTVQDVYADRNSLGLEISGSGSIVRGTTVRRCGDRWTGTAIRVKGGAGSNDPGVTLVDNLAEQSGVGIEVLGAGHQLLGNVADSNRFAGISVVGMGSRIEDNRAQETLEGAGFDVSGTENVLRGNLAWENDEGGFLITGDDNLIAANSAGDVRRGNGNHGSGYIVTGVDNQLQVNDAYRNDPLQYEIGPNNIDLGGNRAAGVDFLFGSSGASIP